MKKKNINIIINTCIIISIVLLLAILILFLINKKEVSNRIVSIDYNKYSELINSNEAKIIILSTPTCPHCSNYKKSINYVIDEYKNIEVYDLNISELKYEEYLEIHDKYNGTKNKYNDSNVPVILTPTTIIVKDGEEIYSTSGDLHYTGFTNLLKTYQLIK